MAIRAGSVAPRATAAARRFRAPALFPRHAGADAMPTLIPATRRLGRRCRQPRRCRHRARRRPRPRAAPARYRAAAPFALPPRPLGRRRFRWA